MASFSVLQPNLPEHILQPFPSDPNARSYFGGTSTIVYFVNDLPSGFSAQIYYVDDRGERILWGSSDDILRSEYLAVTTYTHQPWEVAFSRQTPGENVTKIYHPHPSPSRVILNEDVYPIPRLIGRLPSSIAKPLSFQESRSTKITFVNLLKVKVLIRWVDFNGYRHVYGSIRPGLSSLQATYVGHIWEVVTADYEKTPIVFFYAAPFHGLAEINDSFLSGSTSD